MSELDFVDESKEGSAERNPSKLLRLDLDESERAQLSLNSITAITSLKKPVENDENDATVNGTKRSPASTTGDTRYSLGIDFVVTALLAVAGITKVRQERKQIAQAIEDPQDNKSASGSNQLSGHSMNSSSGYWPNHEGQRATVIIGTKDCLCMIATAFFQNADVGWLIADINKHRLLERWQEKTRVISVSAQQILELPLPDEIENFLKNKSKEACSKNMITIVLENNCSKEKLEEKLAPVIPKLLQD